MNFQVYNNNGFVPNGPFYFLRVTANKTLFDSSIRNNDSSGSAYLSCSDYVLDSRGYNTISGNHFNTIEFKGNYWIISNNHMLGLSLYGGNYLDIMNNSINGFSADAGLTYANIVNNMIEAVFSINLGTNARFVNNVIRNTYFNTAYLPGYDIASNKWGNNMWADGIDRLVFANGEEIGDS